MDNYQPTSFLKILIITVFLCKEANSSCSDQISFETVPADALIPINGLSDDDVPEFIVNSSITKFQLNCSKKKHPVLWKVKLAKAHVKSTIQNFANVTIEDIQKDSVARICHTTTIDITEVGENITGLYTCVDIASSSTHDELAIFIYGGKRYSWQSRIINRGDRPVIDIQDRIFESNTPLRLPCLPNAPANITVVLMKLPTGNATELPNPNSLVHMPSRRCGENICIDVKKIARSIAGRKGILVMCQDGNKNRLGDIVIITVLLPDFKWEPVANRKSLNIPLGQKLRFICRSDYPVRMTTNYSLGHTLIARKEYYDRQATYFASLELTYGHPLWMDQWNTMDTSISCERTDKMSLVYTWNYTFVKTQNNETYNDFESQTRLLSEGKCATLDPKLTEVYIVPCSTYTECQMKSLLLYSNNTQYKVPTSGHHENIVQFAFPKNSSSFMVRCVGFQSDVMTIIYKKKSNTIETRTILSTAATMAIGSNEDYPVIWSNVAEAQEIIIPATIRVNCTVPVMAVASRSYWTVTYTDDTESIIPSGFNFSSFEKLAEGEETIEDGMSTVSLRLHVNSTNIRSLNCINYQFTSVQPFIWEKGLFVGNDDISVEQRKTSLSFVLKEPEKKPSQNDDGNKNNGHTIAITVFGGIFTLSVIITTTFLLRAYIQGKIANQLQDNELRYFLQGRPELISDKENANSNAQHKAYNESNEIDRKDLQIDYQDCLGSGEFGVVYKGVLHRETPLTVAVKSIKPGAGASYLRSAMAELKVMLYVQSHENIIRVIGACTKKLIKHELFVVMEYSENGSLLHYLQKNSENFINQVKNGNLEFSDNPASMQVEQWLATTDLIRWANQISNGMEYISGLNVIHGDLAARNILLDANFDIKISDFGLSKKMYEFSQYVRKNSCPVPWRWLAVESLNFTEFSCSSDIWAFGVTLWEIFSLGAVPYPGQEFNLEFIKMLTNGYRLPLPEYSTFEIYNIMLQCWRKNPHERPKFDVLNSQFSKMVENINVFTKIFPKENVLSQGKQKSSDYTTCKKDDGNSGDGYVTFDMLDYIDVNRF